MMHAPNINSTTREERRDYIIKGFPALQTVICADCARYFTAKMQRQHTPITLTERENLRRFLLTTNNESRTLAIRVLIKNILTVRINLSIVSFSLLFVDTIITSFGLNFFIEVGLNYVPIC